MLSIMKYDVLSIFKRKTDSGVDFCCQQLHYREYFFRQTKISWSSSRLRLYHKVDILILEYIKNLISGHRLWRVSTFTGESGGSVVSRTAIPRSVDTYPIRGTNHCDALYCPVTTAIRKVCPKSIFWIPSVNLWPPSKKRSCQNSSNPFLDAMANTY